MNKAWTAAIAIAFFGVLAAGCEVPPELAKTVLTPPATPSPSEEKSKWQPVGEGVERLEFYTSTTTPTRLVLYRMPAKDFEWNFENSSQPQRVSAWAKDANDALLVVNGTYFHEDNLPSGFLVSHGTRVGSRKFDLDRSGVIAFSDQGPQLINTKTEPLDLTTVKNGAQSYPFIILDGQPSITEDSGLLARRTFLGLDRQGLVYIGVAPDEPVTLRELAQTLAGLDILWDKVINLDGGTSTGLGFRSSAFNETLDSYTTVPNVITVRKK